MRLTRIAAAAVISGAIAFGGFGTGIAYADPGHGHGHGNGDWGDYDGPGDWRGPYYGPAYYGPPQACVSATGPYGYVSANVCI
jgi:hypothetical protein